MKARGLDGFPGRLAELRTQRGLSQAELGQLVGVSKRVITYYENESTQPPGALLVDLARALRCSLDELLGWNPIKDKVPAHTARLRKRLRKVEDLSPADQRTVLKLVNGLARAHRHPKPRT